MRRSNSGARPKVENAARDQILAAPDSIKEYSGKRSSEFPSEEDWNNSNPNIVVLP
jgi:hypothetical protein